MFIFVVIVLILIVSDMLKLWRTARRGQLAVYLVLTAMALTGAYLYYSERVWL